MNDTDLATRAIHAMHLIPSTIEHDTRAKVGMGARDAGVTFDDYNDWQMSNPRYDPVEVRSMWNSYKDGPVKVATLFHIAKEYGYQAKGDRTAPMRQQATRKTPEPPRKPANSANAELVWGRAVEATNAHAYIVKKQAAGVPLDALRVLPANDPLVIGGASMAGALVIPAYAPDGKLQSLQLIPPTGKKMNLPGSPMAGTSFTVGTIEPGGVVYVVEGIGQAWACWQATGRAAVVCFGAGNMRAVAGALRERDAGAKLVAVADRGKEQLVKDIAADVAGQFVLMPEGEANNFDASDLKNRDGGDVLAQLLDAAAEPAKPEPRYKLLTAGDLRSLPPLAWRVRGVLPAVGLVALYGPSASGKSFLAMDMAAAIAEGEGWFDCRVEAAPVVYAALEGEGGFKLRAQAWEVHQGRDLPDGLQLMMQPFKLTDPRDVSDLAAVVPAGAVVFIDTLNRAAPTADENSSKDMGEILEAAKRLQRLTGGLVVLVHHTGKNAAAGLRGHSSLFAAMDAAIEVSRDGDRREWKVAKSKDGADGDAHPFKLHIEALGFDEYGDPVTSCTVRVDTNAQDVQRVKLPQGGNQRLVYEGIRGLF